MRKKRFGDDKTNRHLLHFICSQLPGFVEQAANCSFVVCLPPLLISHQKAVKIRKNKTCVINDPLGQTDSLASSDHCFLLFIVLLYWKSGDGRTDERTNGWTTCAKTVITTCRDCGLAGWINKTGVINNPLGQPKVPAGSDCRLILKFWDGHSV